MNPYDPLMWGHFPGSLGKFNSKIQLFNKVLID